jgi:hypothetical protein
LQTWLPSEIGSSRGPIGREVLLNTGAPSMPIRAHLSDDCAFDPEAINAISTAFELACADLGVFARDRRGREIIATRIIELARNGVVDPAALHQRIVAEARVSL